MHRISELDAENVDGNMTKTSLIEETSINSDHETTSCALKTSLSRSSSRETRMATLNGVITLEFRKTDKALATSD